MIMELYKIKTSDQSNLTQDHIATADGWFNRIRQVAAMCPPIRHIGATWQMRLNLCILQPIRVHNPNGKSIGSAVLGDRL